MPAYMHLNLSSSSDGPSRALVLAVGNLGTAKVSAGAEERRRVTGKAAAKSHSPIYKEGRGGITQYRSLFLNEHIERRAKASLRV